MYTSTKPTHLRVLTCAHNIIPHCTLCYKLKDLSKSCQLKEWNIYSPVYLDSSQKYEHAQAHIHTKIKTVTCHVLGVVYLVWLVNSHFGIVKRQFQQRYKWWYISRQISPWQMKNMKKSLKNIKRITCRYLLWRCLTFFNYNSSRRAAYVVIYHLKT